MVYTPTHLAVEDREVLFDHIERTGLALLIGVGAEGPLASHAPMHGRMHASSTVP